MPATSPACWPRVVEDLLRFQEELAAAHPEPWTMPQVVLRLAGCFVVFGRGGSGKGKAGERGWAAAAIVRDGTTVAENVIAGEAGGPYQPGLLFLREGPLLAAALIGLGVRPDALLVNATGRDHPRRAGLAVHLGALFDLPTVGVTDRPLCAEGEWPADSQGRTSELRREGEVVGYWLRTRAGTRPVVVHAGWRTDPETAVQVVLAATRGARTPEPIRRARHLARLAREGRLER